MTRRTPLPPLAIALAAALLAPAVGAQPPQLVRGEDPPVAEETVREIGDVVYESFYEMEAWVLDTPFEQQVRKKVWARAPAGTLLARWAEGRVGAACSPEDQDLVVGRMLGFSIGEEICFVDRDDDGRYDEFFVGPGGTTGSGTIPIAIEGEGPAYSSTRARHPQGFRRELLYLGVDGTTLRFQYREHVGTVELPTLDQVLTYTLRDDGTATVRFRGLELTVHDTSDGRIRFTLVSGISR